MDFNEQQVALFTWGATETGSCNLIARAGTGKTTTIIELAKRISGSVFLGAFNRAIAEELKTRIQRPNVEAGTMHSLGFKLWRGITKGRTEIDAKKTAGIIKRFGLFDFEKETRNILNSAVGFAKQGGFGLQDAPSYMTHEAWTELFDYHDFWDELPGSVSPERMLGACVKVYAESLRMCQEQDPLIDFDDMILAPLMFGVPKAMYDWVMIDEAQDTNMVRRKLAQWVLKPGGRMVAVGDPHQCQPGRTLVTLEGGKESLISDLKVGDRLVCFDQRGHNFVGMRTQGRTVTEISKRHYTGDVIEVRTTGKCTTVTPNHKFFVRWNDRSTGTWVTYLMKKGGMFRVGWCQLFTKAGDFHLGQRARLEEADAAWILDVHKTKAEASMQESTISVCFGLPLLQFKSNANSGLYTQKFLDTFWEKISRRVVLLENAIAVLKKFGRDIQYPFYTGKNGRQGRTTCFETQACNLVSHLQMMSVPVYNGTKEQEWSPLLALRIPFEGDVYSLNVETHHNYVADGILTKNSIYGFAGASQNAMDQIKEHMGSIELPLSITYRCPKSVVALAQTLVPDILAHESSPEGVVRTIGHQAFWKEDLRDTDVILCRNTRPLIGVAKRLRKMGIPCAVEGANGKALIALASKWGEDIQIGQMEEKLAGYVNLQVTKWEAKNRLDKAEGIKERYECLLDIASELEEFDSVKSLVKHIEEMFGERYGEDNRRILRLCTVHRAKGREWDRVFLLGRNVYMPSKWAKAEWELGQEDNLVYVAWTRAKRELVEVNCKLKKKPEDPDWWEL